MAFERNSFLHHGDSGGTSIYDGVPVGTFAWWFGPESTIPSEWVKLDGRTFDAEEYPELYVALGSNVLPNVVEKIIKGNDVSRIDYPEIRIAGTSLTEYQSSTEGYDTAHDESTEIKSATITAIPIIKAGKYFSSQLYYDDETIDVDFSDIEQRVSQLEQDSNTQQSVYQTHLIAQNAHADLFNTLASTESENQLQTDVEYLQNLLYYDDESILNYINEIGEDVDTLETNSTTSEGSYNEWMPTHMEDNQAHHDKLDEIASNEQVEALTQSIQELRMFLPNTNE